MGLVLSCALCPSTRVAPPGRNEAAGPRWVRVRVRVRVTTRGRVTTRVTRRRGLGSSWG